MAPPWRLGERRDGPAGAACRQHPAGERGKRGGHRSADVSLPRAFPADTRIALTGADCRARLDGAALPAWWGCAVRKGQQLELRFPRRGARGYLCVAGGIDVPQVLGSRSTALRGGFGGLEGRPLQRGDVLACGRWQGAPPPASGIGIEPPEVALSAPTQRAGRCADPRHPRRRISAVCRRCAALLEPGVENFAAQQPDRLSPGGGPSCPPKRLKCAPTA